MDWSTSSEIERSVMDLAARNTAEREATITRLENELCAVKGENVQLRQRVTELSEPESTGARVLELESELAQQADYTAGVLEFALEAEQRLAQISRLSEWVTFSLEPASLGWKLGTVHQVAAEMSRPRVPLAGADGGG